MIIKIDGNFINLDKVNFITIDSVDQKFQIQIDFDGKYITMKGYSSQEEAIETIMKSILCNICYKIKLCN